MSSSFENNKRIAKNTLFLYFRSIITLAIGLYTNRVILAQLGVSDFGIYNIVGSVIVLFSFIQNTMTNATSRFFTFDLGKGDFEQLKKTFNLSVVIHIFSALVILILGETVGLWFLNTRLVIPVERMDAANFVYQFSIFSACIGILQVPYTVVITAYERMKIFAYAVLVEATLKLVIVLVLGLASVDKLKLYSILLFSIFVIMIVFYRIYCHKYFLETHFKWFWNKKMFLERLGFSGWMTLGWISVVVSVQGINMLLNIFHGVIANAAYGIMNQVSGAVNQFTNSYTMAVNPQIIKSCAKNDFDYLYSLIFRSIKFAFFLMLAFVIPLFLNMDFLLHLWLKTVPLYAVFFCQWILVYNLINILGIIISTAVVATAKIKTLNIIGCILTTCGFVAIYILFKNGFSPKIISIANIIGVIISVLITIFLSKNYIQFPVFIFIKSVLLKIVFVSCIVLPLPVWISFKFDNWRALFITSGVFFIIYIPCVFLIGLSTNERKFLVDKIREKFIN